MIGRTINLIALLIGIALLGYAIYVLMQMTVKPPAELKEEAQEKALTP